MPLPRLHSTKTVETVYPCGWHIPGYLYYERTPLPRRAQIICRVTMHHEQQQSKYFFCFNALPTTKLQLVASFLKLFKILLYEILESKFGFSTQTNFSLTTCFHVVRGRSVNFMQYSLETYEAFDGENDSGCKASP